MNIEHEDIPWELLFETADKTIRELIAQLPQPVQEKARNLPCLLEKWDPEKDESTALGRYMSFEPGCISEANGPIFIFVGDLYLFCREERLDFVTELRRTYLHELCHHFGLDEPDISERGLE